MVLSLTDIHGIVADPEKKAVAEFLRQYPDNNLLDVEVEQLRDLQIVLTNLNLYASSTHPYYADGDLGPVTRRGYEMARSIYLDNDEAKFSYAGVIIDETAELIQKSHLSDEEILQLQQNLNFLEAIDALEGAKGGREDYALSAGKVDGYMGRGTAAAIGQFAQKYGVEVEPGSVLEARLERYDVDYFKPLASEAPETSPAPRDDVGALASLLAYTVMTQDRIADVQTILTGMGKKPGAIDGIAGKNTINGTDGESGLVGVLKDHAELMTTMSEDALAMVWEDASPANRAWLKDTWEQTFPEGNAKADWIKDVTSEGNIVASGNTTLLRPEVYRMLNRSVHVPGEEDITVRDIVEMVYAKVGEYNKNLGPDGVPLDANLIINQMYKESAFNSQAVGPEREVGGVIYRAKGIAQFTEQEGRRYGLNSDADRLNPMKAIPAMIQKVGDDTQTLGNQRMAEVKYNAGGRATHWGTWHEGKELTIDEWMAIGAKERAEKGEGPAGAWRNETFEYVQGSHSDYWGRLEVSESRRLAEIHDLPNPPSTQDNTGSTMVASANLPAAPRA